MTLPNRLGYNSKQHALQKRYLQQQQQQQTLVAAHQFAADPNYAALSQQQLSYGTQMQANQYGAAFNSQPHYQAQQLQMFNNQAAAGMMANQGMMQTQMMSPQMSPAMSQTNQMMPSPAPKKSKKRKSQAASSNDVSQQTFSTPEIQKKKKPKKKTETPENEESSANISSTPTPPSIQFGNSGIIKSPKVIKEEITQINEVFEKAIVSLIDRFKNVKIREKTHLFAIQPSLLTYKEEEKYKPKEEEIITTFPSNNATSSQDGGTEEGSASTSVAPQQSLFNATQQVKLIQNYPVFSVNRQNDVSLIDNSQSTLQEEEKSRRRLFYKDGQSEYLTSEDVIDEIVRDTDCYFKREMLIHNGLSETQNNIISFLHARTIQFIENNRSKFEKFLSSADNVTQLTMFLNQHEEFQPLMHQLRSVIEHAGHIFEERTREEASSIILQSGSTADVTDEAIDQFQSTQDDMNQDKNVALIEMTPRDILLVFLGKDANSERHEDVTTFLDRFKELQKQYRVECSYIDDALKKWQETFERVLNNQSSFRVVSFEEKHRCKKSLEARFGLMKQLLKDKYLTKILSTQENTLMRSKRRGNLPRHATNVLKSWLYSHFLHPYPTESEKKDLCMETGLTLTQVNNWFINQRVRTWRPMLESMLDGDQKDKATPSSSKPQEGKKRGKRNQQSPVQQQPIQQQIQQQVQPQMMNPNLMGIPDSMGSPNYAYANWSSNQYGDPNFPFFPGDVTDEQQ
ncbi:homeobox protein PKNOX1-like protein [Naegleria gruberi]|uniref:Homeobox protein PKNOX1-like protein n=1 Tax=Naegleria gruberi TaxID=5762 RepID=D2V5D6_NAEGR|nr:homeobox protein PKNOX1-like protein [Naegleria gruberi]EFC47934.1 homeobox protein PKNOX1-like protein [Naegleria gruberi]|eukprot:XP_002680678.1 homeobox protein PKNOX1-like protein [Naegleria gruberi strain NEG-M]